jgi:hypothetical protein
VCVLRVERGRAVEMEAIERRKDDIVTSPCVHSRAFVNYLLYGTQRRLVGMRRCHTRGSQPFERTKHTTGVQATQLCTKMSTGSSYSWVPLSSQRRRCRGRRRRRRRLGHLGSSLSSRWMHCSKIPKFTIFGSPNIEAFWPALATTSALGALSFAATCAIGCTLQTSLYTSTCTTLSSQNGLLPPVLSLTMGLCTLIVASNVASWTVFATVTTATASWARLYTAPFYQHSQSRQRILPHSRRHIVGSNKTQEHRKSSSSSSSTLSTGIPALTRSRRAGHDYSARTTFRIGRGNSNTCRRRDWLLPEAPNMEQVWKV